MFEELIPQFSCWSWAIAFGVILSICLLGMLFVAIRNKTGKIYNERQLHMGTNPYKGEGE